MTHTPSVETGWWHNTARTPLAFRQAPVPTFRLSIFVCLGFLLRLLFCFLIYPACPFFISCFPFPPCKAFRFFGGFLPYPKRVQDFLYRRYTPLRCLRACKPGCYFLCFPFLLCFPSVFLPVFPVRDRSRFRL